MAPASVSSNDIESSWPVKTPYMTAKVLQVRIGKVKPCFATAEPTGIFKTPQDKPVKVGILGCEGDERSFPPHTGPDNALMQYASKHYKLWQAEYPEKAHLFQRGGFGENLVTEEVDENTLCIGDILSLGDEVRVEVTKPRQPCYKLNQRFEIKNMSWLSQKTGRTGWYYRILRGGNIKSGDKLTLLERKNPKWTIAKIQQHLYEDPHRKDEAAMKEIVQLPGLGEEIRLIFQNRLKKVFKDDRQRLQGTSEKAPAWSLYTLVERQKETPRITSFIFEAHQPTEGPEKAIPGSHIRVKLGEKESILRSYSIVQGDSHRFKISVSLDPSTSKGGSQHLHEKVKIGDRLLFGPMKCDFPLQSIQNNASSRGKVGKEPQHVFIAGGVGITAFMASMEYLHSNSRDGQDWHLYYAVRSKAEVAFKKELGSYGNKVTVLDGSKGQRIDLVGIIKKARLSTNSPIYVCGPTRLQDAVISTANTLHFPTSMLHFEAFDADITGDPFTVEVLRPKKILEVGAEQSLMEVLREAGLDIASSCEVGNCGTCKVYVKEGKVEHRGTGLPDSDKKGSMLSCVSRGTGRIVLDLEGCDVAVK